MGVRRISSVSFVPTEVGGVADLAGVKPKGVTKVFAEATC